LLIQATKTKDGNNPYNSTAVNFLIETAKGLICVIAYLSFDHTKWNMQTTPIPTDDNDENASSVEYEDFIEDENSRN